jgi:hypothetical protein
MIRRILTILAEAFLGWGFLFGRMATWCIEEGYRRDDLDL